MKILLKAYSLKSDELCAEEVPIFPNDCPFGHLEEKYAFILTRLNLLNEKIDEIHLCHETNIDSRAKREYISREKVLRPLAISLSLASELKILTDELISLNCVLSEYSLTQEWPNEIAVDCIGAYLNLENKNGFEPFNNNIETIKIINHIGNAIKHSFINSEILWKRNINKTPMLIAFHNNRNKLVNGINYYEISLPELISKYNIILDNYKKKLNSDFAKHLFKPHR